MSEPEAGTVGKNESDSNADTCCLGANFIILRYTQRTADVYPYDSSYAPMTNVPIVTGATAWTDKSDNRTYILIFNESLYYGKKLNHSLLNPNQIRHNGIDLWDNPFDKSRNVEIDIDRGPIIPMQYQGTQLSFTSRAPSDHELSACEHIEMTSVHPWDPTRVQLSSISSHSSNDIDTRHARISSTTTSINPYCHSSRDKYGYSCFDFDSAILHDTDPSLVELKEIATSIMNPPRSDVPTRRSFVSHDRHLETTAEILSELWGIGLNNAKATMAATTQMATRSAVLPISRRYRADKMYGVKRLQGKFSTDTS